MLNWLEIFNESQVTLCTYHLYVFCLYVPDYDTQYFMGWVFIVILSLAFLINIFFILFQMFKDFRLLCIKYWRMLKEKLKKWCPQKEKPEKETPLPPMEELKKDEPTPHPTSQPPPPPKKEKDLGLGAYQP